MLDLIDRTKKVAIDIVKFCCSLPQNQEYQIISKQLIRCAISDFVLRTSHFLFELGFI